VLSREVTVEEINAAMKEYADGSLKGILQYSDEELVSSDLIGNQYSSIFSSVDTVALGNLVKAVAWYDNEWGYSCRIADLVKFISDKGI
jgi:glyceraldehyde 3-phosphate dehydrogenase